MHTEVKYRLECNLHWWTFNSIGEAEQAKKDWGKKNASIYEVVEILDQFGKIEHKEKVLQ